MGFNEAAFDLALPCAEELKRPVIDKARLSSLVDHRRIEEKKKGQGGQSQDRDGGVHKEGKDRD
jgi:hypothetical protein